MTYALSQALSNRSKFMSCLSELVYSSKFLTRADGTLNSTSITTLVPKVKLKGVSRVGILGIVQYAQSI